ncbi:MAG: hypothetical protein ACK4IC_11920, partial [Erythrobacter sp.]
RMDPVEAMLRRQRYLPRQLAATRRKLEMLRREACRLGMPELVIADEEAAKAMRQESIGLPSGPQGRLPARSDAPEGRVSEDIARPDGLAKRSAP